MDEKTKGKTILLVRHAKSSWDDVGLADEARPLNDRGKKDAPEMAKRLRKKDINIDLFLSSPAKRARRTARYFAEEFGVKKDDIEIEDRLYGADSAVFLKVLAGLKTKVDTVAVFSHNPGITEFANTLTEVRVDNMPTSSVFAVHVDTDDWNNISAAEKKFVFFDYPKNPMAKED